METPTERPFPYHLAVGIQADRPRLCGLAKAKKGAGHWEVDAVGLSHDDAATVAEGQHTGEEVVGIVRSTE